MNKPTPRPWKLFADDQLPDEGWPIVQFRDWSIFSTPMPSEQLGSPRADAAHIVKCVNMYEEMLELLMEASNCLTHEVGRSDIIVRIDELIAKAKAGGGDE